MTLTFFVPTFSASGLNHHCNFDSPPSCILLFPFKMPSENRVGYISSSSVCVTSTDDFKCAWHGAFGFWSPFSQPIIIAPPIVYMAKTGPVLFRPLKGDRDNMLSPGKPWSSSGRKTGNPLQTRVTKISAADQNTYPLVDSGSHVR